MVLRGKAFSGRCLSGQPHHEGSCFLASLGSCIFREQDLLCWLQLVPLLRRQPGEDGLDGSLCSTVETDPRPHSVGIQHSEETPMVKISENTNGNGLSQTIVKTHQVMLA